jgi:hypothetical protein
MKKKDDEGKNDERRNGEGRNDKGRNEETVRKKKKEHRSLDANKWLNKRRTRREAISGASRIIVIEVHYPTYCTPSCPPYQISNKNKCILSSQ